MNDDFAIAFNNDGCATLQSDKCTLFFENAHDLATDTRIILDKGFPDTPLNNDPLYRLDESIEYCSIYFQTRADIEAALEGGQTVDYPAEFNEAGTVSNFYKFLRA